MELSKEQPDLTELAFFEGINDSSMTEIANCARLMQCRTGTLVARQGEAANEFYLIREGRLAVGFPAAQAEVTIQTLRAGDLVGWSWLMPPYQWQFDIRAVSDCVLIAIDGRTLRENCEVDRELGYELMKRLSHVMVERLRATRLQLLDVYGE